MKFLSDHTKDLPDLPAAPGDMRTFGSDMKKALEILTGREAEVYFPNKELEAIENLVKHANDVVSPCLAIAIPSRRVTMLFLLAYV